MFACLNFKFYAQNNYVVTCLEKSRNYVTHTVYIKKKVKGDKKLNGLLSNTYKKCICLI